MNDYGISVLISTYDGEAAVNLQVSLKSVIKQQLHPHEVVLVVDEPISDDQRAVIKQFVEASATVVWKVIWLEQNVGRGTARNIVLEQCSYPLIAIMDSDDISCAERFSNQVAIFKKLPDISLVASWQIEFDNLDGSILGIKKCPETHQNIVRALKWRNVIPNPSIMVRKDALLKVGGYGNYRDMNEDYDLFIKLIQMAAKLYCIQKPLIKVRIDKNQRKRRGGWDVIRQDLVFRWRHVKSGFFNPLVGLALIIIYFIFRVTPHPLKKFIYLLIRSKHSSG